MASPFQFSVNVNDVFRSAHEVRQTVRDFEDDLVDLSLAFQHEFNQTERYRRISTSGKYGANLLDTADERERKSWEDSLARVQEYEQIFKDVLAKHPRPRVSQDAPLAAKSGASWRRSRSRYLWATGGKTRAEVTLDRLRHMNARLKEDLDMLVSDYTERFPKATARVVDDVDAQDAGLAITTTLRTVERNQTPPDAALSLFPSAIGAVHPMGPGASLTWAKLTNERPVFVEYRGYTVFHQDVDARALRLATFLNRPKPVGLNVLSCVGVFNDPGSRQYGFLFDPQGLQSSIELVGENQGFQLIEHCQSLSTSLGADGSGNDLFRYSKFGKSALDSAQPISLSQRFHMAHSLARTVHQLHMVGWLHQNISSDNIWFSQFLEEKEGSVDRTWAIGEPYLFSFEYARKTDEYSDPYRVAPQGSVDHNLYRHPDRQGVWGNKHPHSKYHDIYSLGVVLLEIGLGRRAAGMRDYLEMLQNKHKQQHRDQRDIPSSEQVKEGYLDLTRTLVPEKMGSKYAAIITACLTGSFRYGDEDEADACSLHRVFRSEVVEPLEQLADTVDL